MKDYPVLTNSRKGFTAPKKELNEILGSLGAPHIESFNHVVSNGLMDCVQRMIPIQFEIPSGDKLKITIEEAGISRPTVPIEVINVQSRQIYPKECRLRGASYTGILHARIGLEVNGVKKPSVDIELGEIPIMVKSKTCNLNGLTPSEMIKHGEHENEWGGYFINKGNEKIIRMLLMTRRNYPIAVQRSSWKDRGRHFTALGIFVRSVRSDFMTFNNVLHYLNNGTAKLMFSEQKRLNYVPVCLIMKALSDCTDEQIYKKLINGFENDSYYDKCIQSMLREVHEEGIHTQEDAKSYLGQIFRSRMSQLPIWATNNEITEYLLKDRILLHLDDMEDKFNMLVFMVQKLFQYVQDNCKTENLDGVMMQEILEGGHMYQKVLTTRLEIWLKTLKLVILKRCTSSENELSSSEFHTAIKQTGQIGRYMQTFLATGNITFNNGLGLMQYSGFVIAAENINRMRYMSHFRAVHRGSFFTTMRTTEARQLLPDAWGFICPVHTPDGTPCGLLNHLTVNCKISEVPKKELVDKIPEILTDLGMMPNNSSTVGDYIKTYTVILEGKILGHIRYSDSHRIVDKLRSYKIEEKIPKMTEIVLVPYKANGQFPGLFLFVGPSRMMRPVQNLKTKQIEYIGTFEQVYMDVAIENSKIYPNVTTHLELSKIDFMSNLANLIPMPDCNQSPRNMYQCQMGKQTMGTPCHNYSLKPDTKLYRLQTPATPLFRPVHHDNIELDDFAMGTNAIVAVISYTGYDMEDAMIINKSAFERGLAHGSVYKSQFVELSGSSYFARDPQNHELIDYLDNDGLPYPGMKLEYKCPLYCYFNDEEQKYRLVRFNDKENGIIDSIKYCGDFKLNTPKKICITYRIPRNPSVGDKFASRAGQKGICSQKYPAEDLPFTESGLIPDIVFNPHGFPSRMTIAMMIEIMAGKSASVHGLVHDASPFKFTEKNTAIDYFGKLLEKGGYNYYGTEKMYSGFDGREMNADIFFGVVHYQRLRHMVSDKWQVRSLGAIDAVTRQPIKGRKRGGGVRFGEMERDALISHGASYLLHDRLFLNSDKFTSLICNKCGTLLGALKQIVTRSDEGVIATRPTCRICNDGSEIGHIDVPYVFKYLASELNSVNINSYFIFDHI